MLNSGHQHSIVFAWGLTFWGVPILAPVRESSQTMSKSAIARRRQGFGGSAIAAPRRRGDGGNILQTVALSPHTRAACSIVARAETRANKEMVKPHG